MRSRPDRSPVALALGTDCLFRSSLARRDGDRYGREYDPGSLHPRSRNRLHTILEPHLGDFCDVYEEKCAATGGMFRLDRIRDIAERFLICGDQLHRNPHQYWLVLERGFDEDGAFISIPLSGLQQMTKVCRRLGSCFWWRKICLSKEFAQNLLSWRNVGFSIDNSGRDTPAYSGE